MYENDGLELDGTGWGDPGMTGLALHTDIQDDGGCDKLLNSPVCLAFELLDLLLRELRGCDWLGRISECCVPDAKQGK